MRITWFRFGRVRRERAGSIAAVAMLHLLLGDLFVTGLGMEVAQQVGATLKLFDVVEPPPPEPPAAVAGRAPKEEGASAPPALEARASPVMAPKPPVVVAPPPPIMIAPMAADGWDRPGASDRAGPGTGAGGKGSGVGAGGSGTGTGGGGGSKARQIAGKIRDRDYPKAAQGAQGTVYVRFTVGIDGRAHDCQVLQSSQSAVLDTTTCRLIQARYRYEPARDAQGRLTTETRIWKQMWWLEPR